MGNRISVRKPTTKQKWWWQRKPTPRADCVKEGGLHSVSTLLGEQRKPCCWKIALERWNAGVADFDAMQRPRLH